MLTSVHNDTDDADATDTTDNADDYNRVFGIALLKAFRCMKNGNYHIWLEIPHIKSIFTMKTGYNLMKKKLKMAATIVGLNFSY